MGGKPESQVIWRATVPNVLFTTEAANFYWNKRSKKRFPKSALGIKACFPRNQEKNKKNKTCTEIWTV